MPNIFTRINEEYYSLTGTEKRVADYVAQNSKQTQYMSISELADACGVALATITRFSKRLGYPGFSAFKVAVATSTALTNGTSATDEDIDKMVLPEDSIGDLAKKVYNANIGAMSQSLRFIDDDKIKLAVDYMVEAKHVLCVGVGGSSILAQEAAHLFTTAFKGFSCVMDTHLQAIAISQLDPGDVVFVVSYSGSIQEFVTMLQTAKARGARTILLTRFPNSPIGEMADICLQNGANDSPLQMGTMPTRMAQLLIVDILYQEMWRRNPEECKQIREAMAESVAGLHF